MNKKLFYLIWLTVILIGPITVFINTPLKFVLGEQTLLINFLQRIVGLMAFSLIFSQVILGSFMGRLTQKLGAWIYKFHITEGVFTYLFILGYLLLFLLLNYKVIGKFDPFYVFTDICIICKPQIEYFYTFGRAAFWFLTIRIIAVYFRTHPWLRVHWRKFHILNYFAFYLIAYHAWGVGSDTRSAPFVWFFWLAVVSVSGSIIYKLVQPILLKPKEAKKNSGKENLHQA